MVKRIFGDTYSDKLFEGPDFSELCNHNGKCEYLDCRFRHYGDNPRNALMEELHKKIALKAVLFFDLFMGRFRPISNCDF